MRKLLRWLAMAAFVPLASMAATESSGVYRPTSWLSDDFPAPPSGAPVIRVAAVGNGDLPFLITATRHNRVEGIIADYLYVIGSRAGLRFEVHTYPTLSRVLEAVRSGEVELAAAFESDGHDGLIASIPYFGNRQVIVRRDDAGDISRPRVALVADRNRSSAIDADFPPEQQVWFANAVQAMTAVANGQADVAIANVIAANHIIDQLQLLNLSITDFAPYSESAFAFVAREDEAGLIYTINDVLVDLPIRLEGEVRNRWDGAERHYRFERRPTLRAEENAWIASHPVVRYAAMADVAPFLFLDKDGRKAVGMSVDLLARISERTGLRFEPVWYTRVQDVRQSFSDGNVWLVPVAVVDGSDPSVRLPTQRYAQTLWAIVTRANDNSVSGPGDLAGKRVGVLPQTTLMHYMRENFPAATLVPFDNFSAQTEALLDGHVDAVVREMAGANYIISQRYQGRLRVASTLNDQPMSIGMAVVPTLPILRSILDKAIDSIAPEEMESLRREWSPRQSKEMRYGLTEAQQRAVPMAILGLLAVMAAGGAIMGWRIWRRRRSEQLLKTQVERQNSLLDGLPSAVFIRDEYGRVVACNARFAADYGRPQDELVGQLLTAGDWSTEARALNNQLQAICAKAAEAGEARFEDAEVGHEGQSGNPRWIMLWAVPLRDGDQPTGQVIAGWTDISERKRVERDLESARLEAETANRSKSAFLATISHEIRTPMNAILGLLELQLDREGPADKDSLRLVRQSAQSLLRLISDILDFARIEAGKLNIVLAPASLAEELARLSEIYSPLASERRIGLDIDVDEHVPPWLMIDAMRVRQVVGNLLSNAIKFTNKGGVTLTATWTPDGDARGTLRVVVRDTGIGIRESDQAVLFQPFSQGEGNAAARFGGTGLGLSICQGLVQGMGGTIRLDSQYTVGTTITVDIPVRVAAEPEVEAEAPPSCRIIAPDLRVLIVDDHAPGLILLTQQLKMLGVSPATASNGFEALEAYERNPFDVIITDISMPIMDGYTLAREIRSVERARGLPPSVIVGCSADARPEAERIARGAGMDECLTKPLALDTLAGVLERQVDPPAPAEQELHDDGPLRFIRAFSSGNVAVEREFLQSLLGSNAEALQDLAEADRVGNVRALREVAHKLKGCGQMIGSNSLIDACAALSREVEGDRQAAVAALRSEVERTSEQLERLLRSLEDTQQPA
ncbi:ATP-binding protein [Uliginosibacterium sp. sgz301328]|uniref:ATP-binding protein n=1 Tax=Uliginosibacterium sp. sgz301328 TaxID=3243764 RepID=UPI00359E32FE